MKNFSLDSITIKPKENEAIKKAIVLLHGYGGDGSDISMLSHNWKRHLKNTVIICPNGHERCKINPSGFQWFDLSIDDEDYILNQKHNHSREVVILLLHHYLIFCRIIVS